MEAMFRDDFLLEDGLAKELFESCRKLPIIDFHGHLPVEDLAKNRIFANLASIWLEGDHYKWRAMRLRGVPEAYCSGNAPDEEKFAKWAETVPNLLRNPLYHWTHMELKGFFGIAQELNPATAKEIWDRCNAQLAQPSHSAQGILTNSQVEILCTTDDPADALTSHAQLAANNNFKTRVYPTFRPDKVLDIEAPGRFNDWLKSLGHISKKEITGLPQLLDALHQRHDDFHAHGGKMSDHGLEQCYAEPCSPAQADAILQKLLQNTVPDAGEIEKWRSFFMLEFGKWNYERGWVMQLHLGAIRNNNARMFAARGFDTGTDSIGDFSHGRRINAFLSTMDQRGHLPRIILYNSNPRDNLLFATIMGNFFQDNVLGKVQYGPAWWFLDTYEGMRAQIDAISQVGLLSQFVGMVTDSRSFLSFFRHDYFRRLMSQMLSDDIKAGRIPNSPERAAALLKAICYDNPGGMFA